MKDDEKIVMYGSPEAAKVMTVTGWVSRHGDFWGNDDNAEHMARYGGCTHVPCSECGQPVTKSWTTCDACRAKKTEAKEAERERQAWDGETPLYHEGEDRYYFGDGDVDDACACAELDFNAMEFLICEPVHARLIELDDFHDDLPDEDHGEAPDALIEAIDAFNAKMKDVVLCWRPTDIVAIEGPAK